MPRRKILLPVAAILASMVGFAARATSVTVDFSATLIPNTTSSVGVFNSGDTITGSFTYDTGAGTVVTLCCGFADYVLSGATVTDVNTSTTIGFPGNGGNPDDILIGHTVAGDSFDITAYSSDYDGLGNGYMLEFGGTAPSGSAFTNGELPASLSLGGFTLSGGISQTELNSVSMAFSAPEPASVALLGIGTLALGMIARRWR